MVSLSNPSPWGYQRSRLTRNPHLDRLITMGINLNSEQAKGLAGFFFDVAKGLVLGGFGFAVAAPPEVRTLSVILSSFLTFWCVRNALSLLEDAK